MKLSQKIRWVGMGIIVGAYIFSAYMILTNGHNWGGDFSSYLMQTQSLATNTTDDFLTKNTFTIENSSYLVGPSAYPWGYPIILLPFYLMFGLNLLALKIPNIILFALFLIAFEKFMEKRLPIYQRFLIITLLAFNPALLVYQNNLLTDIPFVLFSTASLLLINKYFHYQSNKQNTVFSLILIGVSILFCSLMRNIGFLLLVTMFLVQVIYFIYHRKKTNTKTFLIFLSPYGIYLFLNIIISKLLPNSGSGYMDFYDSFLQNIINLIVKNSKYYALLIQDFFVDIPYINILYILILIWMFIGIITRIKDDYVYILFFFSLLGLLIISPFVQGIRYLFPLFPFIIYFSFQGAIFCLSKIPGANDKITQSIVFAFWGFFLLFSIFSSTHIIQNNISRHRDTYGPFDPNSQLMANYLKNNTSG